MFDGGGFYDYSILYALGEEVRAVPPMLFIRKLSYGISNQVGHVIHSGIGFPIYAILLSSNASYALPIHDSVPPN
ncbi:hypothetical protein D0860_08408 [Hortaea werneckii]|uniref:Uncharacterized protein n=1 Tax=Hortaea werneckii TaxID=91943 RepID=A0A3M7GE26_HORWE|nr:hypothetical protein D0860_08408 [Hortaea werneckii]